MLNNIFITKQDILNSLSSSQLDSFEKSAGWANVLSAGVRRIAAGIPRWFTGKVGGMQGGMRGINWLFGGGQKSMNVAGTKRIWSPTRGNYNTNTGSWFTDKLNKARNWVLDKTYNADRRLGSATKKLDRWVTAKDEAAFGKRFIRKPKMNNGVPVMKDGKPVMELVENPEYKKWLFRGVRGAGTGLGIAGSVAATQIPVVGDVLNTAWSTLTPAGVAWTVGEKAWDAVPNYIADKYVVPEATNAAYRTMQSTLDAVNNMTPTQRIGFLLAPQQAQRQMQQQAEQEFARQAFAEQQKIWRQRRQG